MPRRFAHVLSDSDHLLIRRRLPALALTLVAHLLLLLGLLQLAPAEFGRPGQGGELAIFDVLPEAPQKPRPVRKSASKSPARSSPPPAPPAPPVVAPWPYLIPGLEGFDLGKAPQRAADTGAEQLADGGAPSAAGAGPDGKPLYQAEWYREPTDAELVTYMPSSGARVGWGLIACQTIERYHVDNCRELGKSPTGSGFARGLRQAAWQFLVRPPRLGGKPLVGAWVSIRIEFTERGATARSSH